MRITDALFICFVVITLNACSKVDNPTSTACGAAEVVTLESNSPVVVGWPLEVKLPYIYASGKYTWTGPNGFKVVSTATSDLIQNKITTVFADSGIYKLTIEDINEGCIIAQGTTKVSIINAPNPPCSIINNTSTSTLFGVGKGSYTAQHKTNTAPYIGFTASCSDGSYLNINFNDYSNAQQGVYKTNDGFYPDHPATSISVYYQNGMFQYNCKALQNVYVTKTGTTTTISFCNLEFNNASGSTKIVISGRVTF